MKIQRFTTDSPDFFLLGSCRFCGYGIGYIRVESEEGIYYLCERHYKDMVRDGLLPDIDTPGGESGA